jgi:hypothetical protein
MTKDSQQNKEKFDLDSALYIADNYMRLADRAIKDYEIVKLKEENGTRGPVLVAISSLAFALEIYLKSILFCLDERTSKGHDLEKLWHQLDKNIKHWLTLNFENNYKPTGANWHIMLIFSPYLRGESKNVKINIPGKTAFDMIKGHRNAFSIGRYGYELPPPPKLKPVLHDVNGLQILSCLTRGLAYHLEKELTNAKKALIGKKRGGRIEHPYEFPTDYIDKFPSDSSI